jgi:two-component system nitrogen regulation sensor histidine kinase GlnL
VPDLAFLVELQPVDRLLRISREENLLSAQQTTRTVVRGLAHEVKNPLGGIRGAAQLLERELPEGPLREYTRIIIREADRLRDLVDRLLGPNAQLKSERLNVHEVSEHVLQLLRVEAGERAVLERDYDPSLPDIEATRAQLIQALLNILRNALQATATAPLRDYPAHAFPAAVHDRRDAPSPGLPHRCHRQRAGHSRGPRETLFMPMVSGRPEGSGSGCRSPRASCSATAA